MIAIGAVRGPETTTPAGGGPAGVVLGANPREEVKVGLFAIAGEEVGFDEILRRRWKEAMSFRETTPAAGGGAAGAVLLDSLWEEDEAGRIRQGRGGGRP